MKNRKQKTLSTEKIEEIEKIFSKIKKYHDYDDIEYRGIRDIKNLFDWSIDEDYYKPIKSNDAINSNYIEYESKGDKNKTLSIKGYLNMIRPSLKENFTLISEIWLLLINYTFL